MTWDQAQRIIELLEGQTELLEAIAVALVPEAADVSDECQHPEDHRVDFRSVGEAEHWVCNICRYEHRLVGN